jgi:hypothetical protein
VISPSKRERLQQLCEDASNLDAGRQCWPQIARFADRERQRPVSFHGVVKVFGN